MLFLRLLRYTTVSCALLLLLGELFVGQQLLRSYLLRGAISGVVWPLLTATVSNVLEVALVLGTPLGVALALALWCPTVGRESAGGSGFWRDRVGAAIGFGVLWFTIAAGVGAQLNLRLGAPAVVARRVLRGAREDCTRSPRQQRSPELPLLNARWICRGSAPPRLFGTVQVAGVSTSFSAQDVDVSDDLTAVDLNELEVESPAVGTRPKLHLAVRGVSLRGVMPWAKVRPQSPVVRAVLVAGLAAALGAIGAIALGKRHPAHAQNRCRTLVTAAASAALGGGIAWALLAFVDAQASSSIAAYLCIPLVAGLAMVVASLRAANRAVESLEAVGVRASRRLAVELRRRAR